MLGVKACQNGLEHFFPAFVRGCKGMPEWYVRSSEKDAKNLPFRKLTFFINDHIWSGLWLLELTLGFGGPLGTQFSQKFHRGTYLGAKCIVLT